MHTKWLQNDDDDDDDIIVSSERRIFRRLTKGKYRVGQCYFEQELKHRECKTIMECEVDRHNKTFQ